MLKNFLDFSIYSCLKLFISQSPYLPRGFLDHPALSQICTSSQRQTQKYVLIMFIQNSTLLINLSLRRNVHTFECMHMCTYFSRWTEMFNTHVTDTKFTYILKQNNSFVYVCNILKALKVVSASMIALTIDNLDHYQIINYIVCTSHE